MRLIIHCGVHRTGTTTIQNSLSANRDILGQFGISYPFQDTNHQWVVEKIKLGAPRFLDKLCEDLKSISETGIHTTILSAEDFSSIPHSEWLRPLSRLFEVEIVVYLRRQDLWINSWYNQNIKWPWYPRKARMTAEEFLEDAEEYFWLNYYELLSSWSSVIGKQNLSIGCFERPVTNDLAADFLHRIGHGHLRDKLKATRSENESLGAHALEFIRLLGVLDLSPSERYAVVSSVAQSFDKLLPQETNMVYAPSERRTFLAKFSESNAKVAREYLGRSDGALFADSDIPADAKYVKADFSEHAAFAMTYMRPLIIDLMRSKN